MRVYLLGKSYFGFMERSSTFGLEDIGTCEGTGIIHGVF